MNTARVAVARPGLTSLVAAVFLAAALAALLATTAVTSVRAGVIPACSVLVSTPSTPVPSESATIHVGEQGVITGSGFTPDTELTVNVTLDGVDQGTFGQMTDGTGAFTITGTVAVEQIGVLVLTATDGQVCSDFVTITVLAAVASPTPGALPDAAMAPSDRSTDGGVALLWAFLLAVAIAWSAVLEVRYRRRTR